MLTIITSPYIQFFLIAFIAGLFKSDLKIPEQTYDLSNASILGLNSYSEILGTDTIQSNSITLTASTNYFWLNSSFR